MARRRIGAGKDFIVDPRKCILAKGETFGDRRYRYKNWWCLSADEKRRVAGAYPYKTPGIPDSAYAYPIDARGRMPSGRVSRTLIWGLQHVKRKVARTQLAGARRRRRSS